MRRVGREALPGERRPTIGFVGFHALFNRVYNHITLALRDHLPFDVCDLETSDDVPEYLIFSVYSQDHRLPRYDECVKIFTCEENLRTPWHECDYALTGDRLRHPSHLRLPVYAGYLRHLYDHTGKTLVKSPDYDAEKVLGGKTRFCNFVYSNAKAEERILFFQILSKYKRVDSGGAVLNNLGTRVRDKLTFLSDYKFTIAMENSRHPGYITEKLVEPMAVGSLPIYWGCRDVGGDFNPLSFVHANEPAGSDRNELLRHFEQVAQRVAWLDQHDDEYLEILSRPWFLENRPNQYCCPGYITDFFRKIFSTRREDLPIRDPAPSSDLALSAASEECKEVELKDKVFRGRAVQPGVSWSGVRCPQVAAPRPWVDPSSLRTPVPEMRSWVDLLKKR